MKNNEYRNNGRCAVGRCGDGETGRRGDALLSSAAAEEFDVFVNEAAGADGPKRPSGLSSSRLS